MSIIGKSSWFLNRISNQSTSHQYWKIELIGPSPGVVAISISEIGFFYDGNMNYLTNATIENFGSVLQNNSSSPTGEECIKNGILMSTEADLILSDGFIFGITLEAPKTVTAVGICPYGYTDYGSLFTPKILRVYYSDDYLNWIQTPISHEDISYEPPPDLTVWPPGQFRSFPTGL